MADDPGLHARWTPRIAVATVILALLATGAYLLWRAVATWPVNPEAEEEAITILSGTGPEGEPLQIPEEPAPTTATGPVPGAGCDMPLPAGWTELPSPNGTIRRLASGDGKYVLEIAPVETFDSPLVLEARRKDFLRENAAWRTELVGYGPHTVLRVHVGVAVTPGTAPVPPRWLLFVPGPAKACLLALDAGGDPDARVPQELEEALGRLRFEGP